MSTLDGAVRAAVDAVEVAGRRGARLLCLPETGIPGHRLHPQGVPDADQAALDRGLDRVAAAARRAGVITVVGAERATPRGRQILSVVFDGSGQRLGEQVKTQVDPAEEPHYIAGSGRRVFTAGDLVFGIAICHEAFRHPETVRAPARAGAKIVLVPHYVTTDGGPPPTRWCDPASTYHEKALMCRAMENTVFVAAANFAGADQGCASCLIDPDGTLLAQVAYGEVGVATADLDLDQATGRMAVRYAPDRNQ